MMMLRGYVYIVAAALLWGMIGPFSRMAFQQGISPMEVAFWRAFLAWILFAAHAVFRREVTLYKKDIGYLLAFGFCGVTLFYYFYQMAVRQGGAALAAVLLYTAPAWVVLFSRIFFREAITPTKLLALILTLSGVSAISIGSTAADFSSMPFHTSAIAFGLLSGFCYSLYYIFGKFFSGRYTSATLFMYILPVGFVGMLPWVPFAHKTPSAWLALALLVVICTYGANSCYYAGLGYLEAGRAAIAATVEPVMAAAVAFFWWGEVFSPLGYLGSLLVLSAVILMIRDGAEH